ncbi:Acetolactate synthase large subunit [Nitrosococcus oceani ATCC 19707]|uniref:Acetolactate synthase large subunit n=2 Tax=Nitrosococcus oceani TaxID=1229 RepID=Q3JBM9_NITOC|nr:thiamine pyrophosphate-binding protein [Nitrosococcus oceani]ABA57767.1 Acetolactate synthase large subunit [Nitrosococcus oceani ATCC 19707]KFI19784.1 acetolactate synthase [Nitrosococcus oceani C-27]GEM19421.1 acetolactate synthase [Nitrosococcus oceani]
MIPNQTVSRAQGNVPQSQWEAGDLLVAYLAQLSVDYVFGVPGGAIEPLYNALARSARKGGPRAVVARHETGAAFMADGYGRQTGKLAVCCATTGPGATNLITGVASAYENRIPMLVITAQTALSHFGRGALQESSCTGIDTVNLFQHCTRYSTLVSHVAQLEHKLSTAIMTAYQSPNGPTHLSIPLDILRSAAPVKIPSYQLAALLHHPALLDENMIEALCDQIASAKKVVFVVGEDCREAIDAILDLAFLIQSDVVTTPHGKGLVSPYHPLFRGVIGFAGHRSASEILSDPEVDTVVVFGANLGEWASNGWDTEALLNDRLIHVENTQENLTRTPMARLHVRGTLTTICERVLSYLRQRLPTEEERAPGVERRQPDSPLREALRQEPKRRFQFDEEAKYHDNSTPIKPQRLMKELTRLFPSNTRFLADSGNSIAWAIHYLQPSWQSDRNGEPFRGCLDFAAMGWAIGAAVGSALGAPGNPVVCITGDGSWLMSGQEITVASQEQLPVIFIILNDAALGMVKHGQRLAQAEAVGFELPAINYCAYGEAMGVPSHIIRSPQDLMVLDIKAICKRQGPTLLDVRVDPEEVPPMKTRMKVLGGAQ